MKERVVLRVSEDCDLGKYLIALSHTINETEFSGNLANIFWFPDTSVKKNDLIVLYSKIGDQMSHHNEDGTTTHFFYWGLDSPITTLPDACVVLLNASWKVKRLHTST